jgi:hypothetical protein
MMAVVLSAKVLVLANDQSPSVDLIYPQRAERVLARCHRIRMSQQARCNIPRKVLRVALVTHNDASIVLEPRKQALHLPSAPIAAQRATILGMVLAVASVRSDELYTTRCQLRIKLVRLVRVVANEPLGFPPHERLREGGRTKSGSSIAI